MGLQRVPDLDSLELLLQVAATGSLGRAGAVHGLSQPAVSARIRTMERLVGLPLVERGPRGSCLTPQGALLAGWAQDVLRSAAALDAGAASLRADQDGRLRVAASLTVAEHLLPVWLVRLAAQRPDVVVSLSAMNSTGVESVVLEGAADLGFVEGPHVSAALHSQVVAVDRLVVVVHPGHPWARRRQPLPARELAGTRLVQREPHSGTRQALETALADFEPLAAPLLELSTTSAVRSAVVAGAGPGVLSNLAVEDDVAAGHLVEVRVAGAELARRLRAVWPAGQRPSGPARDLLLIGRRARR
jgi:DNA-binding transcriptional LysR family regulator